MELLHLLVRKTLAQLVLHMLDALVDLVVDLHGGLGELQPLEPGVPLHRAAQDQPPLFHQLQGAGDGGAADVEYLFQIPLEHVLAVPDGAVVDGADEHPLHGRQAFSLADGGYGAEIAGDLVGYHADLPAEMIGERGAHRQHLLL